MVFATHLRNGVSDVAHCLTYKATEEKKFKSKRIFLLPPSLAIFKRIAAISMGSRKKIRMDYSKE